MKKVVIIDTSILCVWLEIPGMGDCGPHEDRWDKSRVDQKLAEEEQAKTEFVLPLATIIETGNHIAQASQKRRECALALSELIRKTALNDTPWAAFSDQTSLWSPKNLQALADTWPEQAAQRLSLGDATIKDVAEYYAKTGVWERVEILTGDQGLKAWEPAIPVMKPRRRQRG